MSRVRFKFQTTGLVSDEVYAEQARINSESGVPFLAFVEAHDTPLAIVGGGPSAGRHLKELQEWPGHIWGINQGAAWLSHAAPKANVWMFTVDPDPALAGPEWIVGVKQAILGTTVSPKLVKALLDQGTDVRLFCPHEAPGGDEILAGGPASVTRTFMPALVRGYKNVTFFGCEGSLEGKLHPNGKFESYTHAYRREDRPRQMIVRCGDQDFVTTPDLYITTLAMVRFLQEYPMVKEKSGGLLRGMLDHPDTWSIVAVSEAMKHMVQTEGDQWGTDQLTRLAA